MRPFPYRDNPNRTAAILRLNSRNLARLTLNMSEGAVTVAIHRVRRRYRDVLRDEIRQTVATPEDVGGELRYLLNAVSLPESPKRT